MPKRLSRAKHNVIARLNRRLEQLCFEAHERIRDAVSSAQERGEQTTYEAIVTPIGRELYSNSEVIDIKKKLRQLGVKGIAL